MKKSPVLLISLFGLVMLLGVAYLYFNHFSRPASSGVSVTGQKPLTDKSSEKTVTVVVGKPVLKEADDIISAVGSTVSYQSVILSSEISGRISRILFADGDNTKKGQLLIELDGSTQLAERKQAKATADLARIQNRRNQELGARGFISQSAVDEAAYKLEVALADLALAEAKYQKTQIKAPFSGVLGIRKVNVGDYIKEGQPLVNVENISKLYVDFQVPEIWLKKLHLGLSVDISVDAIQGTHFTGKLIAIDPQIQKSGRSFTLRAIFENNDRLLKPGLFVRVSLKLGSRGQVLMVPESAIVSMGTDLFIYQVIDQKAVRKKVTTGVRRDALVEITGGIESGAMIIIAGHQKVKDNQPVKIKTASVEEK